MKFFLLINVKMPTIVGILTFMSRKNSIFGLYESEKKLNFLIFLYLWAFKISCSTELGIKKFYKLGARQRHLILISIISFFFFFFFCFIKNLHLYVPLLAMPSSLIFVQPFACFSGRPSKPIFNDPTAKEGVQSQIICSTHNGRPKPNIKFIFNNAFANFTNVETYHADNKTYSVKSVFTKTLTREDNDKPLRCCVEHDTIDGKLECQNLSVTVNCTYHL